jgi:hypothetical protein
MLRGVAPFVLAAAVTRAWRPTPNQPHPRTHTRVQKHASSCIQPPLWSDRPPSSVSVAAEHRNTLHKPSHEERTAFLAATHTHTDLPPKRWGDRHINS